MSLTNRVRPLALALAAASVVAANAGTGSVFAADPLAKVAFAIADVTLFDAPSTGAGSRDRGTWTFDHGELLDGHVDLHVTISALAPALPLRSGPAVLFAGFSLYGDAGGDVALEDNVAPVAYKVMPACTNDADCQYSFDISIPTNRLPAAIDRLEQHGKLIWVSADLTLVRTFAGGQWLQVLPFQKGEGATDAGPAGRLGAMSATHGSLQPAGLFPASQALAIPKGNWDFAEGLDYPGIVERLRSRAGDPSSPAAVVDVGLHVTFEPACPSDLELFLHDDLGNHLFSTWASAGSPPLVASTSMPSGSPWFLSLDGGDGTPNAMVRLGPIVATGSPVKIDATLDCVDHTGTLALTGAATPTPSRTPPVPATMAVQTAASNPTHLPATVNPTPVDEQSAAGVPVALLAVVILLVLIGLIAVAARRRSVRS